ncbi:MAG: rhamnulokinase [Deltaproteobacteria bacterium]|jgi:rhamnulokinase|nr:rhamnulokinase [Deltaproteobacteria bacterium]
MTDLHLAIDLGASSGRVILGWQEFGKIRLEEIYRFPNGLVERNGHLCWDLDLIFEEIISGLKRCHDLKYHPVSLAIDSWGVDFVLLDSQGQVLGETVGYRDDRTIGVPEEVAKVISDQELYGLTGIQKLTFNTIYQLQALKRDEPGLLETASSFLMIPDYLNYLLTGQIFNEYTNATTSGMVNAKTRKWDTEILGRLGFPQGLFKDLSVPKTTVGRLKESIRSRIGFDLEVILSASHDTASAVLALPVQEEDEAIYISSGTWSLMGVERLIPDCTELSREHNFTNEGGYHYRYRYLKNIMGLWMFQNLRKEFRHQYSFEELATLAHIGRYFKSTVEVNDPSFLAPKSMKEAILSYCRRTGQEEPQTEGEFLALTYLSLAQSYARIALELEELTGKTYDRIHILGGGCQDALLNQLTQRETGKKVSAGPVEATAIGNLLIQMLKSGAFEDLNAARKVVKKSFSVEVLE